jgi:hypothetical protein
VHEVIQAEEIGQVSGVTPAAIESGQASEVTSVAEVGVDPFVVMEVEMELTTFPLMECTLVGTSTEHP